MQVGRFNLKHKRNKLSVIIEDGVIKQALLLPPTFTMYLLVTGVIKL